MAAAAGVSRRTLDRAFAADTGLPAHEHLTRLRLGAAKQLLRRAEVPLGEVPARCGYLSLSAFAQMFHGRTGMTPREFRERHGEG
ncbi:MAG: helix-turn-helix transcriptional regulator [Opitutaceae bacterium]|nr:helix-turn-helix transcriptional regulator [Opitutaceae bacterium]